MRDTAITAASMRLAVLVFAAFVASACSGEAQNDPAGEPGTDGRDPAPEDSTTRQDERQIFTGVITEASKYCLPSKGSCGRRILVEEEPAADCSGRRGPGASGCEKTYFDVTAETDVFRRVGDARRPASAADLHAGLSVSADYSGYALIESYPTQTRARAVTILKSS